MTTTIKDFIRFVAGVIVALMIFMVVFAPEGIASNTFNYLTYAEPILLQDWLSTAMTVGTNSPGEFVTSIRTSGNPYTIEIYKTADTPYISILLPQEEYLKTKFAKVEPIPVITDCEITDQRIELQKNLVQTITVRKFIKDSSCIINVTTSGITAEPQPQPPPPPPPSCDCTDWMAIGPCGEPPCTPDEVKFIRSCDPLGCDPEDGMGEFQCIFNASCAPGFDFSISVDPDNGMVNRDLSIDTNVIAEVVSGVRDLVNLSASNLPSDTTISFEYQNFTPPATSKTTITTTGLTPKGTFTITIIGESDGLIRTAEYDLSVVEPAGCCPHVSISVPGPLHKGDIFTINLTYTHDIPSGGSVHLHWPSDKAKFISLDSSVTDTRYLPNGWNPPIMNGNDLVECGSDTKRMYNYDTCNITLQASDGDIDLFYRAWDWSNDALCPVGRVNLYDYDRDPNSGTCSLSCDVFPDNLTVCDTYSTSVTVIKNLHVTATLDGSPTAADVLVVDKYFWSMGDATWDGIIDIFDVFSVNNVFGCSLGDICYNPDADFNEDGTIDMNDIDIISANFGKTAPTYTTEFTISAAVGKAVLNVTNPADLSDIQTKEVIVPLDLIDVQFDFITPCTCDDWADSSCEGGTCAFGEMQQTRTCNPSGCNIESQCVADTCALWSDQECSPIGGCSAGEMYQTRTCTYGCLETSQCIDDPINCCVQPNYWCDSASYTCPWYCIFCVGCTVSVGGCYNPSDVPASDCIDCGWGWIGCGWNCVTSPNCYEDLAKCGCSS
jgi:hypothetical protein